MIEIGTKVEYVVKPGGYKNRASTKRFMNNQKTTMSGILINLGRKSLKRNELFYSKQE